MVFSSSQWAASTSYPKWNADITSANLKMTSEKWHILPDKNKHLSNVCVPFQARSRCVGYYTLNYDPHLSLWQTNSLFYYLDWRTSFTRMQQCPVQFEKFTAVSELWSIDTCHTHEQTRWASSPAPIGPDPWHRRLNIQRWSHSRQSVKIIRVCEPLFGSPVFLISQHKQHSVYKLLTQCLFALYVTHGNKTSGNY